MVVTFKRISNGEFESYADGSKTPYRIVNGSLGLSGNGRNMYGIVKGDSVKWLGPLRTCKKAVEYSLQKAAAQPPAPPAVESRRTIADINASLNDAEKNISQARGRLADGANAEALDRLARALATVTRSIADIRGNS